MTRRIFGYLFILLFGFGTADAAPISRREVLEAIAVLERDVTSPEALHAAETVTRFGKESDTVLITVGEETLPWVQQDVPEPEATARMMLMAVYFAADIKSQLKKGVPEDDPYSGWIAVIKAYGQIRKKQPDVTIPEVEDLIKKERAGDLKAEAEELRKDQEKQERQERSKNMV